MHLQFRRQAAEFDLARGVGGRDQHPEMAWHDHGKISCTLDNELEGLAVTYDTARRRAGKVRSDYKHGLARELAKDTVTGGLSCRWVVVGRRGPLGARHLAGVMGEVP